MSLTETNLNEDTPNENISIENYNIIRVDRDLNFSNKIKGFGKNSGNQHNKYDRKSDPNTTPINLLYSNIQCLRNKLQLLEALIENTKINFICISEHWLSPSECCECDNIHINNYKTASFFARSNYQHGGVLQLIENNSPYDEINWICNLSEELTCELTLPLSIRRFQQICRHP
jgi:hypothetical protein